jgi:hypothetical protein
LLRPCNPLQPIATQRWRVGRRMAVDRHGGADHDAPAVTADDRDADGCRRTTGPLGQRTRWSGGFGAQPWVATGRARTCRPRGGSSRMAATLERDHIHRDEHS